MAHSVLVKTVAVLLLAVVICAACSGEVRPEATPDPGDDRLDIIIQRLESIETAVANLDAGSKPDHDAGTVRRSQGR